MSRQNYYAQRQRRQRQALDADLIEQMVLEERKLQPRLGGRKLYKMLQSELRAAGVKIGRDRFFDVLAQRELLLEPQPAACPCTTHSGHNLPVFTNQIKDLKLTGANQVWVSDITYLRTEEGFLYLALITDKFSRKIVGHHGGDTLETEGCLKALELALTILPEGGPTDSPLRSRLPVLFSPLCQSAGGAKAGGQYDPDRPLRRERPG